MYILLMEAAQNWTIMYFNYLLFRNSFRATGTNRWPCLYKENRSLSYNFTSPMVVFYSSASMTLSIGGRER